jgi:hypothetical protein
MKLFLSLRLSLSLKRKFIERRTGSIIRDLRKIVDDEAR